MNPPRKKNPLFPDGFLSIRYELFALSDVGFGNGRISFLSLALHLALNNDIDNQTVPCEQMIIREARSFCARLFFFVCV